MYVFQRGKVFYAEWAHPDGSGRVVKRSTGCEKRKQAEEKARALRDEFANAYALNSSIGLNLTVDNVAGIYWSAEGQYLKAAGANLVYLQRISDHLGARRDYTTVGIADVTAFVTYWKTAEFVPPGRKVPITLNGATLNRMVATWRQMHNYAAKKKEFPVRSIDWSAVRSVEDGAPDNALSADGRTMLLAKADETDPQLADVVRLALLTGCRKSELLSMRWDRIDLKVGKAVVITKGRRKLHERPITLSPETVELLRKMAKGEDLSTSPLPVVGLGADAVRFRWETLRDLAGFPALRFHDLRHTHGSWMAATQAPIAVVQRSMGHAKIETTMRYVHVGGNQLIDALQKLTLAPQEKQEGV